MGRDRALVHQAWNAMTFGQRFLLSLFIVLAALFGLSLCGYNYWEPEPQKAAFFNLASAESQPVELPICMDEETRERLKSVMMEALDSSLKSHIEHVFEVWLRDSRAQPDRARTGVQQGIKAYLQARRGVEHWAPPPCPG